jgi:multisubunit Na+/H+ antiporter MnhG subunit
MKRSVNQMSREQLVAALPKRLLVMVLAVAALFAVLISFAVITMETNMALPWLFALIAVVLTAPIVVSRMFKWTLAPAKERVRRRRVMMREALASVTWDNGDYQV